MCDTTRLGTHIRLVVWGSVRSRRRKTEGWSLETAVSGVFLQPLAIRPRELDSAVGTRKARLIGWICMRQTGFCSGACFWMMWMILSWLQRRYWGNVPLCFFSWYGKWGFMMHVFGGQGSMFVYMGVTDSRGVGSCRISRRVRLCSEGDAVIDKVFSPFSS